MRKSVFYLLIPLLFASCGSIPPEIVDAMQKEKNGIALMNSRQLKTVKDLSENWYNERVQFLNYIKKIEINKITVTDPADATKELVKKKELEKISSQYDAAITKAQEAKKLMVDAYLDKDNWSKLKTLHDTNQEFVKSLYDLDASQRLLYSNLVGKSIPYPTDFINNELKDKLKLD